MKVFRFRTSTKRYGGNIYETMVDDALAGEVDYQLKTSAFTKKGYARLLEMPKYLFRIFKFTREKADLLIRSHYSAFFNYKRAGVTIIFHVDSSFSPLGPKIFQELVDLWFRIFIRKNEHIVVIAEYWKQFFIERGYKNVHLIYCGYDLEEYSISDAEVESFKQKYNLNGKPIVYIGNPQRKKGADLVYEALKDEPYLLVASGIADASIPVLTLDLAFREYLCLLKAAKVVVTMSQFKEGWNRVAHEAMLLGTPVIGSGMGGMRELLEGGKQVVCGDISKLKDTVRNVYEKHDEYGKLAKDYAEQFSKERFKSDWVNLVRNLVPNP